MTEITQKKRNVALDIFRGLAVFIMILVDAPPDFEVFYPILLHSTWEGITIADLAFPAFVFSMGASLVFSLPRLAKLSTAIMAKKIMGRGLALFALGILINLLPDLWQFFANPAASFDEIFSQLRIFGVLQRLALTYVMGVCLVLALKKRFDTDKALLWAAFFILTLFSAGFHLYNPASPFDINDNIGRAADMVFPGENHVYRYVEPPYDPEGIYGALGSLSTFLCGVWAGEKIRRLKWFSLAAGGLCLMALGCLWSFFDMVGKPLWTAPYVLLNAGGGSLVLALLSFLTKNFAAMGKIFSPLADFGYNPLFFFIVTNAALIILWQIPSPKEDIPLYMWLWLKTWRDTGGESLGALLFALSWCAWWQIFAMVLRQKNICIKL